MKKIFATVLVAVLGYLALAQMYQAVTFFNGSLDQSGLASTNRFYGVFPIGALSSVSTGTLAKNWTNPNGFLVVGDAPRIVFGGRFGYGTNTVFVTGAGSNDSNGRYTFDSDSGNLYTNENGHSISNDQGVAAFWVLRNAEGGTNYRKTVTAGLNGGSWITYLSGVAPAPTSYFDDTTSAGTVNLNLEWSPDGSNWQTWNTIHCTAPGTTNWFASIIEATGATEMSNGYYRVISGTNYASNSSALSNAYLRVYHR